MSHRPADWHVLDLDKDPTPGDPDRVRNLAKNLHDFADDVSKVLRDIKGMAGEDAILTWAGKTAESFTAEFEDAPGKLKKLKKSYEMAGDAIAAYWPELERAQALADKALAKGREAQTSLSSAQSRLTSAESWVDRAGKEADKYKDDDGGGSKAGKDVPKPDPDKVKAATRNATAAEKAQSDAKSDVSSAQSNLDAAKKMAEDARKMRQNAAGTAKKKLEEASDAGIQNRKWWEEVGDWVSDNWDTIVAVCKVVVAVLGVIALIVGGPILAAIVLVAALVVLADTLHKYANGEAGLLDVAFAALDCIPGMKALTSLRGLAKGMKGIKAGLRGLGKGLKGGLRKGADDVAGKGKPAKGRCKNGDPIDMISGEMLMEKADVELPGLLPLVLQRTHLSTYRWGHWYGDSWTSTLDERIEIDDKGLIYVTEDGQLLSYPHPEPGGRPVLPAHGPRWPLSIDDTGTVTAADPQTGRVRHFLPPAGEQHGTLPLRAVTDRNGNRIDIDRDPTGAPTAIRHTGGYHLKVDTEDHRVTALRLLSPGPDPDPAPTPGSGSGSTLIAAYNYDEVGNLAEIHGSTGPRLRLDYDDDARITSWTDSNDTWYRFTYDDEDRCVRGESTGGHLACTIEYRPDERETRYTDALGQTTVYRYNDLKQLLSETDPLGGTVHSEWDRWNNLLVRTDALGHRTENTFDEHGNLTAIRPPDGSCASAVYNDLNLPVELVGTDGAVLRQAWDERGNCTGMTGPDGMTHRFTHHANGAVSTVTDPLGHTIEQRCDAAGLPLEVIDQLGAVIRYDRDAFGRAHTITDPTGLVTRLDWTVEGRLARRTEPDGSSESWTYDAEGNRTSHTDAMGATTTYEYTHFDLIAARTDPDGVRHEFLHDTQLQLRKVTNPQGLTWSYEYDAAGRLVAETDFDERTLTYALDAAGQLVTRTTAAGDEITFERDALGRTVTKNVAGAAITRYTYDATDRLTEAVSPDVTLTLERDASGRLVSETVNGRTLTYTYDALGRRTGRTTPSGATSTWTYDAAGNPTGLTASGRRLAFTHDAAGRELTRTVGEAVTLTSMYDAMGRLSEQELTGPAGRQIQHRAYTYRADGHLTGLEERLGGARHFDLDAAGRVTAVRAEGWTETYAYDAAGNQTSASWPAPMPGQEATGPRAYAGTRITSAGNVRYERDTAGRTTLRQKTRLSRKPDTWHYEWDAEDRLTSVVTPDGTRWRYLYDPLGRRVSKQRVTEQRVTEQGAAEQHMTKQVSAQQVVTEQIDFVWDGTTLCEQTTRIPGAAESLTLTWDHDGLRPLAQTERKHRINHLTDEEVDARFYAVVTDIVGTPTELLDEQGDIAWRTRTTLWGSTVWNRGATAYTPLRFPGQYYDPESELHYNHFRHYDPETARYLTSDPIGLNGGFAPHSYVPNPYMWIDPLGLSLLDVSKNGVHIVVHEYDVDKPAHAHVTGGGGKEVRIGPNGKPLHNQPELSRKQQQAVDHFKPQIRTAVRKLGKRSQAEEREKARLDAEKAAKKACDKG
ncbi:RHS repeat-associated core domain-containing protein [Streptomyces sp. NPDC050658]|uniref:RHS repeat-associated core domain-containing protein n=1 Tax=unclassified Streptomyces TaxID=2593676 RepID=UPI00344AEC72